MRVVMWVLLIFMFMLSGSAKLMHAQTNTLYNSYQDCVMRANAIGEADFVQASASIICSSQHTFSLAAQICASTGSSGCESNSTQYPVYVGTSSYSIDADDAYITTAQIYTFSVGGCATAAASFEFTIDNQIWTIPQLNVSGLIQAPQLVEQLLVGGTLRFRSAGVQISLPA